MKQLKSFLLEKALNKKMQSTKTIQIANNNININKIFIYSYLLMENQQKERKKLN